MDRKKLFQKYYTAETYYKRSLKNNIHTYDVIDVNSDIIKPMMWHTDLIFATELYLKLIIDLINNKVDSTRGHKLRALWLKIPDSNRQAIERIYGVAVNPEALPEDIYTPMRYWWSDGEPHGYMPANFTATIREYFMQNCGTIPPLNEVLVVRRKVGDKWHRIN